ncbi:unnamed protein product [Bursaphelenchus xylophilus]|uniref:Putative hydroxypyruvate isomerase n=1 Tax=Bursaphelenchus xylophilus TaxID=6326 RepID=A0A1I7RP43_BURXY|nr:unnamed protein product [Bursaphelenchus xylophilus]CAG9124535.1 unnamed protein product [Bursaphelenchus xylophilus]
MFKDIPLLERYGKAAKMGFKLVELPFGYTEKPEDLKAAADQNNLHHVLINAKNDDNKGKLGLAAVKGEEDLFKQCIGETIRYAEVLGVKVVHVMAGDGDPIKDLDTYKVNIRYAARELAKKGFLCVIEPINPHFRSTYFLNSFDQAKNIIEELKEPNLKLLFDVFHCQLICGQITFQINRLQDIIVLNYDLFFGHIQVSQPPHRNEPDTDGELNYEYVFRVLKALGKDWIIGGEYFNVKDNADWVKKYGLEF